MRLVLRLVKSITTTEGQKIGRPEDNIVGIQYVFDDYDRAVEYAGDKNLVIQIYVKE